MASCRTQRRYEFGRHLLGFAGERSCEVVGAKISIFLDFGGIGLIG